MGERRMTATLALFDRHISAEHATLYIGAGLTIVWLVAVSVITAM
jgi:hypothetical protein